jgi:hypothetical protein
MVFNLKKLYLDGAEEQERLIIFLSSCQSHRSAPFAIQLSIGSSGE